MNVFWLSRFFFDAVCTSFVTVSKAFEGFAGALYRFQYKKIVELWLLWSLLPLIFHRKGHCGLHEGYEAGRMKVKVRH
jgi:hypothetical protein